MDSMVMAGSDTLDVRDVAAVARRIKGSVSSKQYGYEDLLCPLISEACIGVCPKNPVSFNVDNVRGRCVEPQCQSLANEICERLWTVRRMCAESSCMPRQPLMLGSLLEI